MKAMLKLTAPFEIEKNCEGYLFEKLDNFKNDKNIKRF